MKRGGVVLLLLLLGAALLGGCAGGEVKPPLSDIRQFNAPEYIVGVPQGAVAMAEAEAAFPQATIKYFTKSEDGYLAVQQGKIDAFAYDKNLMTFACASMDDVALMEGSLGGVELVIGISPRRPELKAPIDAFIAALKADGTLDDMYERWVVRGQVGMPVTEPPAAPEMTLKIGTSGELTPMNFFAENGELTGHDIELTRRLAQYLNAEVQLSVANFDGLVAGCETGGYDCIIANLNATPERAEAIVFSEPYMLSHTTLMVKKDRLAVPAAAITAVDQLAGRPVGVITGSIFDEVLREHCPEAVPVYYNNYSDTLLALESGKISAFLTDEPVALNIARDHSNISLLSPNLTVDGYAFLFPKNHAELRDQFNAVLAEMESEGLLAEMKAKWFGSDVAPEGLPELELTGENGTLVLATAVVMPPFSYVEDGRIVGYDIEIAQRICQRLGYALTIENMEFMAIIPGIAAGKYDVAAAGLSITEERKQTVLFSEPSYWGGIVVVTLRADTPAHTAPSEAVTAAGSAAYTQLYQLEGKTVASNTGTVLDRAVDQRIAGVKHLYFDDLAGQILVLRAGKADAIALDEPVAQLIVAQNPDFAIMEEVVRWERYGFALAKDSALTGPVSAVIERLAADGTMEALRQKWLGADESLKTLPELDYRPDFDGSAGVLRFAFDTVTMPMSYWGSDGPLGLEIELAQRIAYELNMEIELLPNSFSSLITMLQNDKADMAGNCMAITEERLGSVDFAAPHHQGGIVLVVRQMPPDGGAAGTVSFWEGLKNSFTKNFVTEDRWMLIRDGLYVTIVISLGAALLGTILGFGVCMLRRSPKKIFNIPAKIFIRLIQGIPIVVFLMILYYVVFGSSDINAIYVAILGFAINFAAYVSEMIRTGIEAVDAGQPEAAAALGFTPVRTFGKIVMPQAARHFLPVYKGEFISMVKMTSVVGYIAIQDLTKMSDIIRSRTYEAFFPLITTALIYFIISYALITILTMIEIRIDPKTKKRRVKGVKL